MWKSAYVGVYQLLNISTLFVLRFKDMALEKCGEAHFFTYSVLQMYMMYKSINV